MSAPLIQVRIKQRTEKWMNIEIIAFGLIKERNIAYKNMKRDIVNLDLARKYKLFRNVITKESKKS